MKLSLLIIALGAFFLNHVSYAGLLSSDKKPVHVPAPDKRRQRQRVVRRHIMASYRAWKGVRYRYGGTTHRGVDCSSYVQHVFKEQFHLALPRTTRELIHRGKIIPRGQLRPGDLVFFITRPGQRHVGIYTGFNRFTHASGSHGVMLSSLDNVYWSRHYLTARRIYSDIAYSAPELRLRQE